MKKSTHEIKDDLHRSIVIGLILKGWVKRDNYNFLHVTEAGELHLKKVFNDLTIDEITLVLIWFCNNEGFDYHNDKGVIKSKKIRG